MMHKSNIVVTAIAAAFGIAMSPLAVHAALPDGYTKLEYIESSGTQYINTGIVPKTTTRVVVDFSLTTTAGGQWNGWGSTGSKESFFFGAAKAGTFHISLSGDWTNTDTGIAIDTSRHAVDMSMSALKFDGEEFVNASSSPFSNAASGNTLYLFAMHQGWSPGIGSYSSMRLYSCQIYDGETLVRDFVPVVQDSDGAAGLYDTVSETFFANGGTGSFVAGDPVDLPDDALVIAGSPGNVGSPSPAYGNLTGLSAGATFTVSCGATVVTNGSDECICQGWKLCDADNNVLTNGLETSFTYEHPDPAKGRKLVWKWKTRPVGADATDLLPTLRLTFDGQSLANTGSGSLTMTGGATTFVESGQGYALDTTTCAPYGSISSVFAANRDSAIAAVAKLGTKSTGILFHFRNGNTSIMLRRGESANQVVLTENNSSSPLITVNGIESGDTEYHLYVVNILSDRVDLYVDGVLAGTTATTPRASNLVNWQFGGRHGGVISGEALCGGPIDDIRVYASALSTDQMKALADSLGLRLSLLSILPIPVQFVATPAALAAGVEPSVTISNRVDGIELVQDTHYTVAYSNNTAIGTAYATITGIGDYDGQSEVVSFIINCEFDPSSFDHAMLISPGVGRISSPLTNFPILVRLSTTRQPWFNPADCAANGADLRFTLADGTLLAHEIDTWNAAGESAVWVNVPELTASTVVTAYWGAKNAAFLPLVNPADTWPDFIAVYEGDATARDSSANGYDAVNAAAVSLGTNAKIGGCASIAGIYATSVTSFIDPSAAKPLTSISRVTVSGWIAVDKMTGTKDGSSMFLVNKYTGWGDNKGGWVCRYLQGYPCWGLIINNYGGSTFINWNSDVSATQGNWLYMTCTIDGSKATKYLNGATFEDHFSGAGGSAQYGGNPATLPHGISPDSGTFKFGASNVEGRMDELRVRDGVASAEWIAADYAQQFVDDFLSYVEVADETFTVLPIPDQTVSSIEELLAGVTPSVTVSNITDGVELVPDTEYTVTYTGNKSIGVAYAVVAGRGEYAAYTNNAQFVIGGIDTYYIVGGASSDPNNHSSISGESSSIGWSTTKGGSKSVDGITVNNALYSVWTDRSIRTPNKTYATPSTSAIVVEPSCEWTLGDTMKNHTLTLSNLVIRSGGRLTVDPLDDGNATYRNTYAGNWTMDEGSTAGIFASKESNGSARAFTLSATVTGRGAIVMPASGDAYSYSGTLPNKIDGDISGFTGDIGTWNGYNAVSLELVNAASLPGDPAPEEIAYVVVTNSATLKVDNDWVSPTNRIWIFGDAGTPTIEVPSGVTLEVAGDLVGSVGFVKKGAGTLVLRGASPDFSGEITISAGTVRLAGKAALLSTSASVTFAEVGGTYEVAALFVSPVPVQVVGSLDALAAGIRPTMVVSNLEAGVELTLDTDYTVVYSNNTASGIATVTVIGAGTYEGMEKSVDFVIHAVKEIGASYDLSDDEDWTGFESFTVDSGVVIDLKGHNLTISGLNGSGTITDSVGGGELHYAVPAAFASGYEATITDVSLTGKLTLVKEGPGKLTAIKSQTFTGGTVIDAGLLVYGGSNAGIDQTHPFGQRSGTQQGPVTINAGGVLDPRGSGGWGYHDLILNGGTVSNTASARIALNYGIFNPHLTVAADSTFVTLYDYGWAIGARGGHTISIDIAINKSLFIQSTASSEASSGRLKVLNGGWLRTISNCAGNFSTIDLDCNAALYLDGTPSNFHDYTPRYEGNSRAGSSALGLYGTFTPVNEYFFAPTMQDGSAIDLSAQTGAWNSKSSSSGTPSTHFAEGASVAILLGGRTPAIGEKIVTWTAATKPADSVSLTNATYVLRAEDDGLYVDSLRTFAANDLPDIGEAKLASDLAAAIESSLVMTDIVTGETLALGTDYTYSFSVSGNRCTVTVTGLGGHDGATVVRTFDIGRISLRQSAFGYSMEIRPTDGKLTTTLTNFPVLVRLSADIPRFSYGKCKADELRFALPDGTLLSHEIDWWNENGESTVWVNVPELTSNTVFTAYWGVAAGREALRTADETWPEYVGVWHFSEADGIAHDSSVNGYDSIDNGGGTLSNLNAKVGLARNANMTSMITSVTKLDSTSAVKPITTMSKFSVSGWMYSNVDVATASKKYPQQIRNKNGWDEGTGWYTGIEGTSDKFCGNGSGRTRTIITLPASIYTNWVYITTIFNDTSCSVYANGAFVTNTPINTVKASTTYPLRFATDFNGIMDEYRIHDRLEDDAYIAADYATQTDSDFLTFGEIQSHGGFFLIVR